jgi:alkanesulfonate monooxygenase SsuD/methylene tetrahydromethanopterin reductase-like flavin-dependent oxidoreductase (luciferase family)
LQELQAFEVELETSQAQWREALEIIVDAFGDAPLEYQGQFFNIPPSEIVPKPLQRPHPPLWLAGTNPETFVKAGSLGLGMLAFVQDSPAVIGPRIKTYREQIPTCTPIGKFVNDRVALMLQTYCGETRQQAYAEAAVPLDTNAELVKTLFLPWVENAPENVKSYEYIVRARTEQLKQGAVSVATTGNIDVKVQNAQLAVGDPDDLIRIFREWEAVGVDQMLTYVQFGGMEHQKILNSLELIGQHVIPQLTYRRAVTART